LAAGEALKSSGQEGIVAKTSIQVVQSRRGHAWLKCSSKEAVNDRFASGYGFGWGVELAVEGAFRRIFEMKVVVD